jgi:hypothetical protein
MSAAAQGGLWTAAWVTVFFAVATLATMTAMVATMYVGAQAVSLRNYERYGQAAAGLAVLLCGVAVTWGF